MTLSQREYDQQLAEVAAGRRTYIRDSLRSDVSWQEREAREENREHASRVEAAVNDQARAAERAIDIAERAALDAQRNQEHLISLAQEQVELEAERLVDQTEHHTSMRTLAEEQVQAIQNENVRRQAADDARRAQADVHHAEQMEAAERAKDIALREHRSASSACYVAACHLRELRELEKPMLERAELESILQTAVHHWHALATPLQESLRSLNKKWAATAATEVEQVERHKKTQQKAAEADVRKFQSLATELRGAEVEVRAADEALAIARRQSVTSKRTWNPLTWGAARAGLAESFINQERAAQERFRVAIGTRDKLKAKRDLSVATRDELATSPVPPSSKPLAVLLSQWEEASAVGRAVAQAQGLPEVVAQVDAELSAWGAAKARSDGANELLDLWQTEPEIDFEICISLDRVLADGLATVSYPGLGRLPRGQDLVDLIGSIRQLKNSRTGSKQVDDSIPGWVELTRLKAVTEHGLSLRVEASASSHDPMFEQALMTVLINEKASASLVQRSLSIGYTRAVRLIEDLERTGLVSSMRGNGQRDIEYENVKVWLLQQLSF